MADFQFYLNRQGIRGLQGVKGDQGDSPIITVQTETPSEYILKITNPDGTELISPNLRGNKININQGTYVRYNTETGELYTSTADGATGELAGVVRLATDADITNIDEKSAVTPSQLADALSQYLVSPDGSVKIVQNVESSLTELTAKVTVQDIDQLKSDVSTLQNEVSVLNTEIDTKSPKLTEGENITLTPQGDGTIKIDSTGGLTELPIASADTLGGVKIGENLSITADGTLTANDGNYIKTSQVSTGGLDYGVYLNSTNGNKLDTIQPKFNTLDGALETLSIQYLKAATYSASEPADEDMVNNWTNKNGYLTGLTSSTGFIHGSVRFNAGSGSSQVVFKLMEAGFISGIDQKGKNKFSKIEISTDGTTYTEYNNTVSEAKYIRFTFNYNFPFKDFASFSTRIKTTSTNIAGGETAPLSVKVDNSTIQIVDDKLHANFDEINGEVSNVSARVTTLEGQVEGISTTVDSNTTDIENLKETKNNNIFDIGKFTVVGSPTITDDGVASGFSTSNYLKANVSITPVNRLVIKSRIIYNTLGNTSAYPQAKVFLGTNYKSWRLSTDAGNTINFLSNNLGYVAINVGTMADGDIIDTDLIITTTSITINVIHNGAKFTKTESKNVTFGLISNLLLGNTAAGGNYFFTGSIDLKQFSITVDGKEVFNGLMNSTKPIYDAIKANNTELSEFKTETSTDFSAVNSALNEKANLSDLSKCASLADFNRLSATVTALEGQVRDVSAVLDNINGEVI